MIILFMIIKDFESLCCFLQSFYEEFVSALVWLGFDKKFSADLTSNIIYKFLKKIHFWECQKAYH